MATYRLFPSTPGPKKAVAYTGPFIAGVAFEVTTGGVWFDGYWWWVCKSGQSKSPQRFALWQPYTDGKGTLISGSTVTSRKLNAGEWNYVPLPASIPLAIGVGYVAATGFHNGFPNTKAAFGAGDQYKDGIVKGPLLAYSDQSGKQPAPFSVGQAPFSSAGSDPTKIMPAYGSDSDNFWLDVQVNDVRPPGASYRLWPNYPTPPNVVSLDTTQETTGTQFRLSTPCSLNKIWFYSPPGVSVLPSRCAIWDVATESVLADTDNTSPSWSGRAGTGWVSCSYKGVVLPTGDYKVSVYYEGGQEFFTEERYYFSTGAGRNGITAGPLSSPNVDHAAPCISNSLHTVVTGNSTYQDGQFAYPYTFDTKDHGENRWIDVEVTPEVDNSGAFLTFFP